MKPSRDVLAQSHKKCGPQIGKLEKGTSGLPVRLTFERALIWEVHNPIAVHQPLHIDVRTEWVAHKCCELFRVSERCQRVEMLTVIGRQGTDLCAAEPVRFF